MLPVNRNSSANMMAAMSPSTSGSRDVIASTLSRFTCAVPVMSTCLPAGVGHRVQVVELVLRAIGEQRSRALDGEECAAGELCAGRRGRRSGEVARNECAHRSGDGRNVGHARQVGGVAFDVVRADAVGVRNDDRHRGVGVVGEVLAQLVADLVCRGSLRQHPVVGKAPPHAEERRAEQQQQRDAGQPERNGTVHDAFRRAIPEPLLDGDRRRLGPAEHMPREPARRPANPGGRR